MSVIRCQEIKSGRSGSLDYRQTRRYVRRWQVYTDKDTDGPLLATDTPGIPTIGVPYATVDESDAFAFVKSVVPEQSDEDPRLWTVTVTYDSAADPSQKSGGGSGEPGTGGASPASRPQNPLDRPAKWSMGFVRQDRAYTKDLDGKAYKNSAGWYFEPARTRPVAIPQVVVSKNYATFNYNTACGYFDKINKTAWKGFDPKTVKIENLGVSEEFENGWGYCVVTWTFQIDVTGWNPTIILDRGPFYLDAGGNPVAFVDALTSSPRVDLLDGLTGAKSAIPQYIAFREFNEVEFSGIF